MKTRKIFVLASLVLAILLSIVFAQDGNNGNSSSHDNSIVIKGNTDSTYVLEGHGGKMFVYSADSVLFKLKPDSIKYCVFTSDSCVDVVGTLNKNDSVKGNQVMVINSVSSVGVKCMYYKTDGTAVPDLGVHQITIEGRKTWLQLDNLDSYGHPTVQFIDVQTKEQLRKEKANPTFLFHLKHMHEDATNDNYDVYIDCAVIPDTTISKEFKIKGGEVISPDTIKIPCNRRIGQAKIQLPDAFFYKSICLDNKSITEGKTLEYDGGILNITLNQVDSLSNGLHKLVINCQMFGTGGNLVDIPITIPIYVEKAPFNSWPSVIVLLAVIGALLIWLLRRKIKSLWKKIKNKIPKLFGPKMPGGEDKKTDGKTGVEGQEPPGPLTEDRIEEKKPTQPTSSLTNDRIAELVTIELDIDKDKKLDENDLLDALRKHKAKPAIKLWNEEHADDEQVPNDDMTLERLMKVIASGYIGKNAKDFLLQEVTKRLNSSVIDKVAIENLLVMSQNENNDDSKLTDKVKEMAEEISVLQSLLEQEKVQNEKKTAEMAKSINNLKEENNLLKDELNRPKEKLLEEENNRLNNELQKLKANLIEDSELKKELDNMSKRLSATVNELAQTKSSFDRTQSELIRYKKEINDALANEKKLNQLLSEANGMLNSIQSIHEKDLRDAEDKATKERTKMIEQYEQQLLEKTNQLKTIKINQRDELNKMQEEFNQKLQAEKTKYQQALQKKDQEKKQAEEELMAQHQKEVDKLNRSHADSITELRDIISDMGVRANVSRDDFIALLTSRLQEIDKGMQQLSDSVLNTSNQPEIFKSIMKLLTNDFAKTKSNYEQLSADEWKKDEMGIQQVKEKLIELFVFALRRQGWMNNLALLSCYCRIPSLNNELEEHGFKSEILERLNSVMTAILGAVDMTLDVPSVLASKYKPEAYDYSNSDTWIDKFFNSVIAREHIGKVFDIVQVGYSIGNKNEKKPIVQYF